jgi:hypothetical protein
MNRPPKATWILSLSAVLACAALLTATSARADEGMWTYDHPPLKQLHERYGFKPDQAWLDHLRLSSPSMGASASFVSADGLILTNHHVALGFVSACPAPGTTMYATFRQDRRKGSPSRASI